MEKVSYKLLKKLYKHEYMDIASINKSTKQTEENKPNPYISYLLEEKMIVGFNKGGRSDGEGGIIDGIQCYRITLRGRDYVEEKRKDTFSFWLPYGITTAIAVASLITTIASLVS